MMNAPQGMPGQDLGKGPMPGVSADGMQDGKGAAARVAALSRSQQPKQGNSWRGIENKQLGKAGSEQFAAGTRPHGDLPLESMLPGGQPPKSPSGSMPNEDSKLGKQMRKPQGKHWADFDANSGYDQDLKALCQDWSKSTGQDLREPKASREGGKNRKDGKAAAAAEESQKGGKASQQQRQDSHAADKQWVAVRQAEQLGKGSSKGQGRQEVATWQPVAAPKPPSSPTQLQTMAAAQQLAAKGGRGAAAAAASIATSTTSGAAGGGGNGGGGKKSKSKKDQRMEDWFSARMAGHEAATAADAAASLANTRGAEVGGYDEEAGDDEDDYGEVQETRSRGKRKGGKGAKSGKAEKSREKGKGKSSGKGNRGYQSRSSW